MRSLIRPRVVKRSGGGGTGGFAAALYAKNADAKRRLWRLRGGGGCGDRASGAPDAPSTVLLCRTVPLPRFAGQDEGGGAQFG